MLLPPPKALPVVPVRAATSSRGCDSVTTPMLAVCLKSNGMSAMSDDPVSPLLGANRLKLTLFQLDRRPYLAVGPDSNNRP